MIQRLSLFCLGIFCFYNTGATEPGKKIKLEDIIIHGKFVPEHFPEIYPMNDSEHFAVLKNYRDIIKYSFKSGEVIDTILSVRDLTSYNVPYIGSYTYNHDETKILLATNFRFIYRYSYHADYYLLDVESKTLEAINSLPRVRTVTFSPDGQKIAFILDNNLYVQFIATNEIVQVTKDGKKDEIINAVPDWVNEEEFGYERAYEWSPGGNQIAFCKFDESRVPMYTFTRYNGLYPEVVNYKYPKAGDTNSIVEVYLHDLDNQETSKVSLDKTNTDYIPRIKWAGTDSILSIMLLNRRQNEVKVLFYHPYKKKTTIAYHEQNEKYISEIGDDYIHFLPGKRQFIIKSERSGYMHLYRFDFTGKMINQVTNGNHDVEELKSIDDQYIYYSSRERSPMDLAIYKQKLDGTGKTLFTRKDGYHDLRWNNGHQYGIHQHSTANMPARIEVLDKEGKTIKVLENNENLVEIRKKSGFSDKEFFAFTNREGISLNGYLIKPPGFSKKKQYPLLMYVYGGPESQLVQDRYMYSQRETWFQYLAMHGYVVACVDNRGTNGRGEAFRKATYMQLGKLETRDQVDAAEYLASMSFIDKERIGIFGWSYGGYLSLLCLAKGNHIFKMAIAVAPVTNWRFYDTIYTERFMRTPGENPEGYDKNSPINHVEKIKGKLLLAHGTSDDNVHFQNTTMYLKELVKNNIQYELLLYPDNNHGLYGKDERMHLYTKMSQFVFNNL